MKAKSHNLKGMTLIELLVVLGLLAALSTYALTSIDDLSDRNRIDSTIQKIDMLRSAMAGDGLTTSRFVNDMGRLPTIVNTNEGKEFSELLEDPGIGIPTTPYTYRPDINGKLFADIYVDCVYGWQGPYIVCPYSEIYDGFGNRFEIKTTNNSDWHTAEGSDINAEITAIRSLGRDAVENTTGDWADEDIESISFETFTSSDLTISVFVTFRSDDVDEPVWGTPELVDSSSLLSSATQSRTYSQGEVFLSPNNDVFRCISNEILSGSISAPAEWNTNFAGVKTEVTDNSDNGVKWVYLGANHQYMSEVKAVIFVPDPNGSDGNCVKQISQTLNSGGNTINIVNLSPGVRWLYVYGGLVNSTDNYANCCCSGLRSIEIKQGRNHITAYLTFPLDL